MKKIPLIIILALAFQTAIAQNDIQEITKTLTDYIEGSTDGQPERLKTAFHPDLNLYSVGNDDKLRIWSGEAYIKDTKEGKPTGEDGKIISIDFENNAAMAKVEISHPKSKSTYIDYFMLLKLEGKWTIIHKMYTKRTSNKTYEVKKE
ncbi:MAG: nuclear transport factor 2 family protein [Bacteroidota bacterium]